MADNVLGRFDLNLFSSSDSSDEEDNEVLPIRRQKRYVRDAQNPFELYDEQEFQKRFRFLKYNIMYRLLPLVNEGLEKACQRGLPIPPVIQLLICLRFYATASFQKVVGDLMQLPQSTISRIILRVTALIATNLPQYIKFPTSDEAIRENWRLFNRLGHGNGAIGLSNIDGAIDCTHIRLGSNNFGGIAEVYRNRKGYFSLNVQAVVGPSMEFLDLVPEYPGSQHDSRIFQNSRIFMRYQQRELRGMLVGDAGYPSLTFLLTPFRNPRTEEEERYNLIQSRTRMVVERTFGVWKRRFPCLSKGLSLKLNTCTAVVVACAILHNILLHFNDVISDDPGDEPEAELENVPHADEPGDGIVVRRNIVHQLFN